MAFAIDAWWDQQRDVRDAKDQATRVVAELSANIEILEAQIEMLDHTIKKAKEILSIMGPEMEPISMHRFGALISGVFAVTTLSLSNSATNNFLSSGQLTEGRWIDIRLALTEMLSAAKVAENSSFELRQMRPKILERLQPHVSALDIARQHPLMKDYAPSRFESDTSALLSDLEFESLVANYAIRMEINRSNVRKLLGDHRAVKGMIEEAQ